MVMNMNHLHIFVKVGEKLNITEAAKELFISQPAVSKAIKNLESSLQLKLLIRDKHHGLMLTDIGKEILLLARQMKGIESKMLYFPSEGHWVLSPQNGLLWHREYFAWLGRFLQPGTS